MKRIHSIFEFGFLCLSFCTSISAGEIHVAVAANFLGTMNEVAAQFEQTTGFSIRRWWQRRGGVRGLFAG